MLDTLNFEHLSREEIENQLWLQSQIVDFDNILHQNLHQNHETFAELIIHQLAKLTQALRGSFFLSDSSQTQLHAVAAYACALENLPKTTFSIGEGLIGQTAKTKEVIYLEDLPKDNIFIESSLGRISVKSLSIIPLVYDKQILGVVELLFLNNLDKKYQALLEKIAENIATILYNIQNKQVVTEETEAPTIQVVESEESSVLTEELTQKLEVLEKENAELKSKNADLKNLSDSIQVQNTNLSNQLEDLNQENSKVRQDNEELSNQIETKQVFNFNELDLERLHLSDETLMILDLDFEGFITKASKKFLEMAQVQEEDLIGKTYDVTHHNDTPVPLFEYVSQEAVREGNFQNCYRVARKDESNYWVKFQMIPVWDTTKQSQSFRLFFYEVTEELEKLTEVKQELRQLLEKKFELEQNVADVKMELAEVKAEAKESKEDTGKLEAFQTEISSLQEKLAAKVEMEYELRDKLLSQMKTVEEIDTLRLKNTQLEEQVESHNKKTEEIESLQLKSAQLEEQLTTQTHNTEELEALRTKNAALENQLANQSQDLEELETLRAKNAALAEETTPQNSDELEVLRTKNTELEEQLVAQGQAHKQEIEVRLAQYAKNLDSYLLTQKTQLEEELEALKNKLAQAPSNDEGTSRNLEELNRELDENRNRLQELEDARQALIARESLLNQVALVSETTLDGVITYANEKFCEISQYALEDLVGYPHNVIRHPDTPPEIFREMWDVIKQGKIFKGRFKNLRRDGSSFWVESNISPVLDDNGNIIKYISIQLDITEEMQRKLGVFQEKNILTNE